MSLNVWLTKCFAIQNAVNLHKILLQHLKSSCTTAIHKQHICKVLVGYKKSLGGVAFKNTCITVWWSKMAKFKC